MNDLNKNIHTSTKHYRKVESHLVKPENTGLLMAMVIKDFAIDNKDVIKQLDPKYFESNKDSLNADMRYISYQNLNNKRMNNGSYEIEYDRLVHLIACKANQDYGIKVHKLKLNMKGIHNAIRKQIKVIINDITDDSTCSLMRRVINIMDHVHRDKNIKIEHPIIPKR